MSPGTARVKVVFAHTNTGNCFGDDSEGEAFVFKCKKCGAGNLCDVCHKHCQPRGDCDVCPPCHRCAETDGASR